MTKTRQKKSKNAFTRPKDDTNTRTNNMQYDGVINLAQLFIIVAFVFVVNIILPHYLDS